MIYLVLSDKQDFRKSKILEISKTFAESEVIVYDDTYGSVAELEQYLYPSLFSPASPIIHLKFIISSDLESITSTFIKKLLSSPTIFLFEEINLPSTICILFKKSGAEIYSQLETKNIKKNSDIFGATLALTAKDKKSRWIAYNKSLKNHSIEAMIGILYWKVRDLATKNPKEKEKYIKLYKNLLDAHTLGWERGVSLELMIEKVILSQ